MTYTADEEGQRKSMSAPSSPTAQRFLLRAAALDDDDSTNEEVFRGMDWTAEERRRLWIGLAFGAASGTLSGLCLLFAKTSTEPTLSPTNRSVGSSKLAEVTTLHPLQVHRGT